MNSFADTIRPEKHPNKMAESDRLTEFQKHYAEWLVPVYRYFYHRVQNTHDAEDLTSQLFLKVFAEYDRYVERGHFAAWLFAMARNLAVDFYRKQPLEIPLENAVLAGDETPVQQKIIAADELAQINGLIRQLPEADQELIRLRFVAGLTYREIGVSTRRTEDAVRKAIGRALQKIETQIEEQNE